MTDQDIWLHDVSVVVTAKYHNPSVLNPGFLTAKGIVPEEWEVEESITTPPMSLVNYKNQTRWDVQQEKLSVLENCKPFQESFNVYSQVIAYIEALPHVPYRSLGLNTTLSVATNDPVGWMSERFLRPGPWNQENLTGLRMVPKFVFMADDAICNLAMSNGSRQPPEGDPEPTVILQSNLHHEGLSDPSELCDAIGRWKEKKNLVFAALDILMKGEHDE